MKREWSAGIAGIFKGKVSNFNQHQIISFSVLIIVILICFLGLKLQISIFLPILIIGLIAILVLIVAGFIRHCFIKPGDDFHETSTRILGVNKAVEITNMPQSLVTKEFIEAVSTLRFFENEPPVGLIKGDVTNDKSIKILTEEERRKFQEDERKSILNHQESIKQQIKEFKTPLNLPFQQTQSK